MTGIKKIDERKLENIVGGNSNDDSKYYYEREDGKRIYKGYRVWEGVRDLFKKIF